MSNPFELVGCQKFPSEKHQPFKVTIENSAMVLRRLHVYPVSVEE